MHRCLPIIQKPQVQSSGNFDGYLRNMQNLTTSLQRAFQRHSSLYTKQHISETIRPIRELIPLKVYQSDCCSLEDFQILDCMVAKKEPPVATAPCVASQVEGTNLDQQGIEVAASNHFQTKEVAVEVHPTLADPSILDPHSEDHMLVVASLAVAIPYLEEVDQY